MRYLALLLCVVLASGCLSNSYELSRDELLHLAAQPSGQRGRHVRAFQQFSTAEDPPPAPAWAPAGGDGGAPGMAPVMPPGTYYYSMPPYYYGWGSPYYGPRVAVIGGSDMTSRGGGTVVDGSSRAGSAASGVSHSSMSGSKGGEALVAAALAAVVIGIVLAFTEGARYDGVVAVHPHHPLHLHTESGFQLVHLDELTPEQIGPRTFGVLVGDEGAGLWHRGRAPLSREGGSYQFGYGNYDVKLDKSTIVSGGGVHLNIGYFPTQYNGILWTGQVIHSSDFFNGGDFFSIRTGVEAHWMPIGLWRLHLGGYGSAGFDVISSGGGDLPTVDRTVPFAGFGGIAEFELNTRLGFVFRYGETWEPGMPDNQRFLPQYHFGLNVY